MSLFQILLKYADGEEDLRDEIFESEDEAEEYGEYLVSCAKSGAEILNMSNPYDNPIDDNDEPDFEVIEVDDDED